MAIAQLHVLGSAVTQLVPARAGRLNLIVQEYWPPSENLGPSPVAIGPSKTLTLANGFYPLCIPSNAFSPVVGCSFELSGYTGALYATVTPFTGHCQPKPCEDASTGADFTIIEIYYEPLEREHR